MPAVSFPLMGLSRSTNSSPSPSMMSMSDPEWLNAVRSKSYMMYCQAKRKPIPMVTRRAYRLPLEVDDSDDEDNLTVTADGTDFDTSLGIDETDPTASAANVSLLFQRLSLQFSPPSGNANEERGEQKPIDWKAPGQLEAFLERCVGGWEMQQQYLAQHERMLRTMEKMRKRINAAEDENALLVWYANHLKGGSAAPLTAGSSASILQEAQSAILTLAATSIEAAPQTQT
ncbi:Golgi apyrase [Sporothrix eucalyptigena]|uniref:Golgi apyrase n=1 Tax=Sporothrix eucalyptigena TaxID=1812306 RepID=A0ABP0AVM5_9PEZI